MPSFILSEEFNEIAFLRFEENEDVSDLKLQECFEEIEKTAWRFVIADFGLSSEVQYETIRKVADFAKGLSGKYFGKLCFVARDEKTLKKINFICNGSFLKNFRNIGDAINYFYWDCCKQREVLRMKMPSDIGLVPSIRASINDFVSLCGVGKKDLFHIELILDELCNNAIEHGTQDEHRAIEVLCSVNEEQVEINVYNGYSPRAAKEKAGHEIEKNMEKWAQSPNYAEDKFRGRGLGIVKKFSDNFEINSSGDGTWVHVIKKKRGENYANTN
jgi:anti-sigma regulatory factor (Ser/Thr protein kinase)